MRHGRLALAHKPATITSNAIYGFLPISIRRNLLREDLMRVQQMSGWWCARRLSASSRSSPGACARAFRGRARGNTPTFIVTRETLASAIGN